MDIDAMLFHVKSARAAYAQGLPITASVHMRHALQCANALKNPALRAGCFRVSNKLRPLVKRATAAAI